MAEANKPVVEPEATEAADTEAMTVTTPEEKSVAKAEEKKTGTKKTEPKKRGRKPAAEKAEPKKRGRKPAAEKKETAAKTTTTRKRAVKENVHIEFSDKSYSTEDLVKIAKDVWRYDLKGKVGDFKSVELYVKPEESRVYYVINGEVTGSFGI